MRSTLHSRGADAPVRAGPPGPANAAGTINLYAARPIRRNRQMRILRRPGEKHFRPFYDYGTVATENRLGKCSGRPLGLCGQRLPELNLIPIQVIDPGKATVGFIRSFGVNLYALLILSAGT